MNKYEVLYVIDALLDEEAIAAQIEKFNTLVTDNGGEIIDVDKWGKRRLAYPINYKTEGYYVLMNINCAPEFPLELERVFKITEAIIRFMVVRK